MIEMQDLIKTSLRNMEKKRIENFKKKILSNIYNVAIDFEIGYAYKKMIENHGKSSFTYWQSCYYFLKGLAHYMEIKTYC